MNIMIEDRGEPFHIWEKTVCFGSKLPEVLFSSVETIDLSFWKPKAKAGEAIAKESATPRRRLWLQWVAARNFPTWFLFRSPVDASLTKRRNKRCMSNLEILPLRMLEVVTQQVICGRKQPTLQQMMILVLQADLTFAIFLHFLNVSPGLVGIGWRITRRYKAEVEKAGVQPLNPKKWNLQWLDKIRSSLECLRDSNLMGYLTFPDGAGFCPFALKQVAMSRSPKKSDFRDIFGSGLRTFF